MMIALCTCLLGWGPALRLRQAYRTTVTGPIAGVEDDPVQWPPAVVRGDWTALDEWQLIRLLTDPSS
jgi:hypothetical protein